MSDLDLSKPVRTKKGDKVEIITTEGRGDYPVIGYIADSDVPDCWTKSGLFLFGGSVDYSDLENIPQKRSGWVNVYTRDIPKELTEPRQIVPTIFPTEKEAQSAGRGHMDYVATAYIEWEE